MFSINREANQQYFYRINRFSNYKDYIRTSNSVNRVFCNNYTSIKTRREKVEAIFILIEMPLKTKL